MTDPSEKKRNDWFTRLENNRKAYFFQKWKNRDKARRTSSKEFVKGIYSDIRYFCMWNINLLLQLKRYGRMLKRKYGISYSRQWYRMAYLVFVLRADSKEFRTLQLHKKENWRRAKEYTYFRHHWVHQQTLGFPYRDEMEILKNKLKFFEFCKANKFYTPEILTVFEDGEVIYPKKRECAIPIQDLFIKDLEGGHGSGVKKFYYANGEFYDREEEVFSQEKVFLFLKEYSKKVTGTIIQDTIKNHNEWKRFSNGSLTTCRIVTCRSPKNEDIIPLFASLRMPVANSEADNFTLGGIAAAIDLETGLLGQAVASNPALMPDVFDFHPDSGERITGEKLFFWKELVEFVQTIHHQFKTIFIGWDVALAEEGLCILEGNVTWGSNVIEAASGVPLFHTNFPVLFEEWVEKRSNEERLPAIDVQTQINQ